MREPSRFRYDAHKAQGKHRIRGSMDFGSIIDSLAVSKCQLPVADSDSSDWCFPAAIDAGAKPHLRGSPQLRRVGLWRQAFEVRRVPVKTFGISSKYETLVLCVAAMSYMSEHDN